MNNSLRQLIMPLIALTLLNLFFASNAMAVTPPPRPMGYVNDYVGLLPAQAKQTLDAQLLQFEKQTNNQFAVAIFPSLGQEDLKTFSKVLLTQWAIGKQNNDHGLLLVIFMKEHKIRLEVTNGLSNKLPNIMADRIVQTKILPSFRVGKYEQGIEDGISDTITTLQDNNTQFPYLEIGGHTFPFAAQVLPALGVVFCVGFLFGRYIGPLLALLLSHFFLAEPYGLIVWIIAFAIYVTIYHLLPMRFRHNSELGFIAGGFNLKKSSPIKNE